MRTAALAAAAGLLLLPAGRALAQQADQTRAPEAIEAPAPMPAKRDGRLPQPAEEPAKAETVPPDPGASPIAPAPSEVAPAAAPPAAQAAPSAGAEQAANPPADPPVPGTPPSPGAAFAADQIADIFSKVGDQLYSDCIFELSEEQVEVQSALVQAYIQKGASSAAARRLAVKQIQPPPLSDKCEKVRSLSQPEPETSSWVTTLAEPEKPPAKPSAPPSAVAKTEPKPAPEKPSAPEKPAVPQSVALAGKKGLAQWDCAQGVDFVTVKINGYERKLTGGEICNPYKDVVQEVPASVGNFKLGYTIKTGRLFVIAPGEGNGQTIAWAISGRDVCRNNPDPDCFAARAIGPLPPGEYTFSGEPAQRVTWGPRTKRHVVGIYLKKLWNQERFSAQQKAAVLARGNIAIHMRLKGEMSEACLGLEPKGWAYVAGLIKEGRANGVNVYIDEPHPQVAEAPPVVIASGFSLTSLFGTP